jgi:hypothetical protein
MIDKLLELLLPVFIALDKTQPKQTAQAPSVLSTYIEKEELK